jgi:hypothetical protein
MKDKGETKRKRNKEHWKMEQITTKEQEKKEQKMENFQEL